MIELQAIEDRALEHGNKLQSGRLGLSALGSEEGLDPRISAEEADRGVPIGTGQAAILARGAKAVGDASVIDGPPSQHRTNPYSLINREAGRIYHEAASRTR